MSIGLFKLISTQKVLKTCNEQGSKQHYLGTTVRLNCDQMEEGEQYNEYSMERNPSAYMSMRDYRNLQWKNPQTVERNPNPYKSMREYRNQWMSAPSCSVPPTYAPPASPYYASTPQPPQPPHLISLVEQAILNLTKLVGDVVEEQRNSMPN